MHLTSARCRPWARRSGHVRLSHGRPRTTRYGTRQGAVMSTCMHRHQRCHLLHQSAVVSTCKHRHQRCHLLHQSAVMSTCKQRHQPCHLLNHHRLCCRRNRRNRRRCRRCPTAASSHSSPTERLTKLPPRGPQAVRAHGRLRRTCKCSPRRVTHPPL